MNAVENDAGDLLIPVPSSIFGRPRNARESRKTRQIREMLQEKETTINHLFSFKLQPTSEADLTETRPIPKCCKTCLPDAEIVVQEEMKYLGLFDCFTPPTTSIHNSIFIRTFPFCSHYSRCITSSDIHNLPTRKELETDPNLIQIFQKEFAKDSSIVASTKQEVLQILFQLQAANVWKFLRVYFIRFVSWICQKYLSLHFESVLVHGGQLELLRDVHVKRLPVVYVPIYRSKFDKVLIMWTLAHHGFRTPLFIRDHNTKNKFLKYFGGIGASLQVKSDHDSEKKYSSAVSVYLQHVLRKGNSIMLNLESGRSRSGRPSPNVYGTEFLKVLFDDYKCNKLEDAYFVPVSVSYELLPDEQEIFGGCKPRPFGFTSSFFTLLRGIVFPNPVKGMVKVDFAQPTSFRELHNSLQKNVKVKRLSAFPENFDSYFRSQNCNFLRWDSADSLNSVSSLYGELAPLYPNGYEGELEDATLLDVINHHLVYDAGKCESIMPTHLVAFILMKKFRSGIHLEQLKDELQWLIKIVQDNKKDLGFFLLDCDMESIAFRAMELLKDDIECQWIEEKQTYKFTPRQHITSLRKLEYYANYLQPIFMMEAVIATAIFAIRGTALATLRGFDTEINIKDDELIYHCKRVYHVLTGGFLLHAPCLSSESAIRKQVSQMSDYGLITLVMRDTRKYMWENNLSDDDYYVEEPIPVVTDVPCDILDQDYTFVPEEVKILTTKSTVDHLSFHRSLLMPYLEIFACLCQYLEVLLEKDDKKMSTVELEKYLLVKLMEMSQKEFAHCQELCSKCTVKQFLITCEEHGILDRDMEVGTMNLFYELKKDKKDLRKQANDILFYVTA